MSSASEVIVVDDDDYDSDTTLPDLNCLTVEDDINDNDPFPIQSKWCRNGPISRSRYLVFAELNIEEKATTLKIGDTWQLHPIASPTATVDFLKIHCIIKERRTGKVFVRGWRLRRNRHIDNMLPNQLNEVCLVVAADEDDPRLPLTQGMETISIDEVDTLRKLVLTNELFPAHSVCENYPHPTSKETVEIESNYEHNLVCRWISITKFPNSRERSKRKPRWRRCEFALIRISEQEADRSMPYWKMLADFLGDLPGLSDNIDMVDVFSGAGGASEGARRAGVDVVDVREQEVTEHIADVRQRRIRTLRPMLAHFSFPCDTFSPANTQVKLRALTNPFSRQGQRDEANQAALLSAGALLETYRPRVVTIEQTSGLKEMVSINIDWFHGLLNDITSNHYSVRWRIVDMAGYGSASTRMRLVFIAAAPGEQLPQFPAPTHGPGRLFPFKTIHDAIKDIRPHHTHHDPTNVPRRNRVPYDASRTQLTSIVTGGGSDMAHPNGDRDFTIRELAGLQGLGLDYKFNPRQSQTDTKRQIGDMVPADAGETIIKHLKECLRQSNVRLRKAMKEAGILDG